VRGWTLLLTLVAVTLLGVLVPYLLLADVASFAASYLFWTLLTLLVIVLFGLRYTARWVRARGRREGRQS